jgi:hypothetical protein
MTREEAEAVVRAVTNGDSGEQSANARESDYYDLEGTSEGRTIMIIAPAKGDPETEAEIRRLQQQFREREATPTNVAPYDPDEWRAFAGPPTPEDLVDMEALRRDLEEERQASLAREAGVAQ